MKEDYNYYKEWHRRYILKWRKLIYLPNRTHKIKYLIQEMRYFIWMLELRKEYFRHYDINAKNQDGYPVCLDWKNYQTKAKLIKDEQKTISY
jgi:hypothetical protein